MVKGNKIKLAIINRYEAIAIEGIVSWAKRMKIAAVDTERIATGKMIITSFLSFIFTSCVSFVGITYWEYTTILSLENVETKIPCRFHYTN